MSQESLSARRKQKAQTLGGKVRAIADRLKQETDLQIKVTSRILGAAAQISDNHEQLIGEVVDMVEEDLSKTSDPKPMNAYTVASLKQKFKTLTDAKSHFQLKANSWENLVKKLNDISVTHQTPSELGNNSIPDKLNLIENEVQILPSQEKASKPQTNTHEYEFFKALLERIDVAKEAKKTFRQTYPDAPEEMLQTAVSHTYIELVGAAVDWLVDLELCLREPSRKIDLGVTFDVLYHLYNWYQLSALLHDGRTGVLQRLQAIKQLVADGDMEAILTTVAELESMFKGARNYPNL